MINEILDTDKCEDEDCPSDELILRYLKNNATETEKYNLDYHFIHCPSCCDRAKGMIKYEIENKTLHL